MTPTQNGKDTCKSVPQVVATDLYEAQHKRDNRKEDIAPVEKISAVAYNPPEALHREIATGDSDIIDYLMEFSERKIAEIETKYGLKVDFSKKDIGSFILIASNERTTKEMVDKGELNLTHLAQDVIQRFRTERIDVSGINPKVLEEKFKQMRDKAKKLGFLLRKENSKRLFILGPGENHAECKKIVRAALGMQTRHSRTFALDAMHESLGAASFTGQTGKDLENQSLHYSGQQLSSLPDGPLNKAFTTKNEKDKIILIWRADITKLHVDAVVNAANCQLSNVTGVASSISRAGGEVIQQECDRYIKNYKLLEVSKVCSTSSGSMPSDVVFHAAGPRWIEFEDESECSKMLFTTFMNCLKLAHYRNNDSIAFPAISDMFGIPKEIVSNIAAQAILGFYKMYPFSTVKWIHLVNLLPESVVPFQVQFEKIEKEGICTGLSAYKSYACWLTEKPLDAARQ